jgi:hypothetical protein
LVALLGEADRLTDRTFRGIALSIASCGPGDNARAALDTATRYEGRLAVWMQSCCTHWVEADEQLDAATDAYLRAAMIDAAKHATLPLVHPFSRKAAPLGSQYRSEREKASRQERERGGAVQNFPTPLSR